MKINCPAKVNLTLELSGSRPDGFHDIRTIFQTIDFADELDIRPGDGSELRLNVMSRDLPSVPIGKKNLVWKAYAAFNKAHGPVPGLVATLTKRIPPGSGLGGGSSNAAAMLLYLQRCCGRPGPAELQRLATALGSDISFFLHGGTVIGRGRGEQLTLLADAHKQLVLLILPRLSLSTAEVYRSTGHLLTSGSKRNSIHRYLNGKGEVCPYREIQRNDLESVVFGMEPRLGRLKSLLYDTGAGFASLTGSGSGLFGLYDSDRLVTTAAARFESMACRTVLARFLGRDEYRALHGLAD